MIDVELGPIQESDKLIIKGIVSATCPLFCVELGYGWGEGSRAILEKLPEKSRLVSYDLFAFGEIIIDERFEFRKKDILSIKKEEINQEIDLIFFDFSHKLKDSISVFNNLKELFSPGCIVLIHDTGLWNTEIYDNESFGKLIGKNRAHQPDERSFCNYIKRQGFNLIHFHSLNQLRHGISIAQKKNYLK